MNRAGLTGVALRAELTPLLPLRLLAVLLASLLSLLLDLGRVLGATITSASGAILAKGMVFGIGGTKEVTMMLAVDVGDRCNVKGWAFSVWEVALLVYAGFGSARI
jgi:hypothetical protein